MRAFAKRGVVAVLRLYKLYVKVQGFAPLAE